MQVFGRELTATHCVGWEWPDFVGQVELGESFIIETEECTPNGPVAVAGVKAGDDIAIHIEAIELVGPFEAPNGGPIVGGYPPRIPLEYRDGYFYWPKHFRLKANPSVGDVAVLPPKNEEFLNMSRFRGKAEKREQNPIGWRRIVRDCRGKHCHQDCSAITADSIVHIKANVDGAGACFDDVHGYIGQGEIAIEAIELSARVQVRIERSTGWLIDWPLIETKDEIMVFSSYTAQFDDRPILKYVDIVREAYKSMAEVVAAKVGCTVLEANTLVAAAVDIRNCALYGYGEGMIPKINRQSPWDIAVVAVLPKDVFLA